MRTRPCPTCAICGREGEPAHDALVDHWFGTPGTWSIQRCPAPDCGLHWLDPMPLADEVALAYRGRLAFEEPLRMIVDPMCGEEIPVHAMR
jgi:hypothetical protein